VFGLPARTQSRGSVAARSFPKGSWVWARILQPQSPVRITYLPYGSKGKSIKQITQGSADFGGRENPITIEECGANKYLQFAAISHRRCSVYNSRNRHPLLFPERLPTYMMGKINPWKHPDLVELNPGDLCGRAITAYRANRQGHHLSFTDFSFQPIRLSLAMAQARRLCGKGQRGKCGDTLLLQVRLQRAEWIRRT